MQPGEPGRTAHQSETLLRTQDPATETGRQAGSHDESGRHYRSDRREPAGTDITPREQLIIRLEHAMHHNTECSRLYERLADEAGHIGDRAAAREILEVVQLALLQNEYIRRALA